MTKVSVIIPVYNVEKYLRECLDSVINQTLKDIEIICINDGSTDSSLIILNEYVQKDSRIKIINKENAGQSSARNAGLKLMTGELCYFLDSDDYIDKNLLEYACTIFDNFDIDYFCFGSSAFVEDESIRGLENMNNYLQIKRDGLFKLNFAIGNKTDIHIWDKVFKSSIIKTYNIQFPEGLLYEDIYFMWFYFFVSKYAYFDKEIYHHYRMHNNSCMNTCITNKTYETAIPHMYNWHELMLSLSKHEKLFVDNYKYMLELLKKYNRRTKELCNREEKYKSEILKLQYLDELNGLVRKISEKLKQAQIQAVAPQTYTFLERIFSVKNSSDKKHKIISLLGIRVKFKRKNKS